MKYAILFFSLVSFSSIISSCSSDSKGVTKKNTGKEEISVLGRWVLIKSEDLDSRKTNHQNQPSNVVLNFQKNGFFIIYDTFVDPSWRKKGFPLIQERTSGQWELKDSALTLVHQEKDTSYTENFKIIRCNKKELVTERSNKKTTIYKTYGKK
ncbi:lipocalin family protein [Fluviicola taffensis]|uniref:Uncharacterized protein n=1 Tax=Fluviicola taffensis (strain DSM 16823 / NCIMB 13979 / RW262) TaxID=755732 RepID=F2ID90_FLUTR|nr:lipocalin family protein [Fluviicola taffensis]AEA45505.1 hypothetical protein Fluta_3536 [Fluviicola taffensis DSM 16823]